MTLKSKLMKSTSDKGTNPISKAEQGKPTPENTSDWENPELLSTPQNMEGKK